MKECINSIFKGGGWGGMFLKIVVITFNPEDGGNTLLYTVGNYLQDYTGQKP